MAKVRFLQSMYLISQDISVNFNDEIEIEDEKQVKRLVEKGAIDVLKDEKVEQKQAKKRQIQSKKDENDGDK